MIHYGGKYYDSYINYVIINTALEEANKIPGFTIACFQGKFWHRYFYGLMRGVTKSAIRAEMLHV